MQKILGYMRKAITEFDLIQNGDRVTVFCGEDTIKKVEKLLK